MPKVPQDPSELSRRLQDLLSRLDTSPGVAPQLQDEIRRLHEALVSDPEEPPLPEAAEPELLSEPLAPSPSSPRRISTPEPSPPELPELEPDLLQGLSDFSMNDDRDTRSLDDALALDREPSLDFESPVEEISLSGLWRDTQQHGLSVGEFTPPTQNLSTLLGELPVLQEDRYEVRELLGGGGQGSVRGVFDRLLGRVVALKAMHREQRDKPDSVRSFLREIVLTAQLNHPGIVAIHDVAILPSGAPCYTMKRVHGNSLRQLINGLRKGDEAMRAEWTRRRLLEVMVQVAHTIGYAHARGVIHRDLKPPNIMLGGFGEVQILDWGVARILTDADVDEGSPVSLPDAIAEVTSTGTIKGTLTYMAPEQALAEPGLLGTWSDVYALGLLLYECLLLRPARPSLQTDEMLAHVRLGWVGSAEERRRKEGIDVPPVPEELDRIIGRCCARKPRERYQNGEDVARALQSYLDGEARRGQSRDRTRQAEQSAEEAREAEHEMSRLLDEVRRAESSVPPWGSIAERRKVWALEDEVHRARTRHDTSFANAVALYTQALGDDPENREARVGLANLYLERLREAEEMGRARDARLYEAQIRRLDDGTLQDALKGEGSLEITVNPASVEVWLYRLTAIDRVYRPTEGRRLGRAPMKVTDLPMGRYLAVVSPGSGREVRCPVIIRRQSHWLCHIDLTHDIPPELVYVPGGPFVFGGDRSATGSGAREILSIPDFAIGRLPVTCEEYRRFLNHVAVDKGQRAADRLCPRPTGESGGAGRPLWHARRGGGFRLPVRDRSGGLWGPDLPVRHISREDGEAFCQWKTEIEGRPYRLPTEAEWEKAARGVDGRWYPWGNLFDPSFCKMRDTRPGAPEPEPVGSVPLDESPYGVRDMAGNIMEWCSTPFDRHDLMGVVKGGFWLSAAESCRAARRFGYKPAEPSPFAGFRVVLDLTAKAD